MSTENAGMLFVFGFGLLFTAIVIAVFFYAASTVKAKSSAAREANYRELAEKTGSDATEIRASLAEIKGRVSTIERMLKEVD